MLIKRHDKFVSQAIWAAKNVVKFEAAASKSVNLYKLDALKNLARRLHDEMRYFINQGSFS